MSIDGRPPPDADPDVTVRRLAAQALAQGEPTAWFERLYRAAESGAAEVPWARGAANRFLVAWAERGRLAGDGRPALVVGCGLGDDAEFLAGLGFDTVAFDVSASAVRRCRERFPDSPVRYRVADLLAPPPDWSAAFDLVLESMTVQALPRSMRAAATAAVAALVAPGGTLLVLAMAAGAGSASGEGGGAPGGGVVGGGVVGGGGPGRGGPAGDDLADGPPWPLTRAEVEAFAVGGLAPVRIEEIVDPASPVHRWRAELRRS
jgi:SAM-dependent methyltransferase